MVKDNLQKSLLEIDYKLRKLSDETKKLINATQDANTKLDHLIWKLKETDDYSGLNAFYDDTVKEGNK